MKKDKEKKERNFDKDKDFGQFAPDGQPGAYGWGIHSNGFKIVMYGPKEWDTKITRTTENLQRQKTERVDDNADDGGYKVSNKAQRRSEKRQRASLETPSHRGQEHGPAHVHVIDKSGRESKFELIEGVAGHDVIILEQNGNGKKPLRQEEINKVTPILKELSAEFIKLWRKFYQDTKLSNYVTRESEIFPGHIARRTKKWVELEDPEGHITFMKFDTYKDTPPPTRRR